MAVRLSARHCGWLCRPSTQVAPVLAQPAWQPLLYLCAEYVPEGSDSVVFAQEQITGEELDVDAKVSCHAGSGRSCAILLQLEPASQHGAP